MCKNKDTPKSISDTKPTSQTLALSPINNNEYTQSESHMKHLGMSVETTQKSLPPPLSAATFWISVLKTRVLAAAYWKLGTEVWCVFGKERSVTFSNGQYLLIALQTDNICTGTVPKECSFAKGKF